MKILTDAKYNALLSEIKNLKLDNELYEKTLKEKNKDIAWADQHTNKLYKDIAELRDEIYKLRQRNIVLELYYKVNQVQMEEK